MSVNVQCEIFFLLSRNVNQFTMIFSLNQVENEWKYMVAQNVLLLAFVTSHDLAACVLRSGFLSFSNAIADHLWKRMYPETVTKPVSRTSYHDRVHTIFGAFVEIRVHHE